MLTWTWPGSNLVPGMVALAVLAAVLSPACSRVSADRAQNQALAQAATAIERYSLASDQANAAHKAVMVAFAKANAATNLADYKSMLRTEVLPTLDAFVAKLVEAYRRARDRIADFERDLQDPSGLNKFDEIRVQLQRAVGEYKTALDQYYAKNKRQLRFDGRPAASSEAAAPAAAATATTAAPQATPSSAP
ncbi:MAG: hypothetical protein HY902_01565 [Deltaproteobacteria bacterium]|nr:hypothetical protein [Deltaproteobacteria bacterium]